MVQVRKLVLAIAAASALSSGMAQALGLGELSVKSTLNQPLVAEIELTEAQGLNPAQVVPSLATTADFAQAGITRQAFLNDLTFTPVINASGKSVLRITSTRPVREPFVKFLVQVLWPNGRLLREYSLLLDPPKYSPEAAAAATAAANPAAPAQLPSTAPATTEPATPPAAPAPEPAAQTPPAAAPASDAKPVLYTTSNNDTLWEIAEKVRNGGTVQQTMLAIQALNPNAFIGGNINRLKKGQVLRLPNAEQSKVTPQPQAINEVAAQNQAWRQGRSTPTGARQLDATRRDRAGSAPSQVEAKDNLSLVSAGSNGANGAAGDKNLANKLAVAEENLDTARRDNAELKSRMNDLQSQLDKMQRLIQLKSDQLAKMQASGAVVPAAAPATPATPAANPSMPAALAATPGSPEAAAKPPGEIAPEDALPAGAAQVTTPGMETPLVVDPAAVQGAEEQDPFKQLLNNPIVLGIIGGAVVLLLLLLMLFLARRRNAKAEAEKHRRMARALAEESEFVSDMDMELPQASFDGLDVPPPGVRMAPAAAAAGVAAKERPADPLVQAEIHIAYGRMNQAVELLEESVKVDPTRDDIRLKLMEIYAEQGNTKAFAAHERKVVARGKNQAEVEQLKDNNPTIAAAAVTAAAATATAAALAAEMDAKYVESLLLDEQEPESEVVAAEPAPQPEPEPAPIVDADDQDNDFDLSMDDLEQAAPEPEPVLPASDFELDAPVVAADEPSFETLLRQQNETPAINTPDDLDDFDLDLAEDEPALTTEDDFLLSLENDPLDLGETPTVAPQPEPELEHDLDLPDDFDLSLADEIETDQATQAFASEIDDVNAELERLSQNLESPPIAEPFQTPSFTADDMAAMDDEPEFDFLSGTDEAATKLDLARAYIEMGDSDGARDILDEVVTEGDDSQKTEAREMLGRLV
ncbi:LysM domain-containing protein [Paucimonas lemoignei]|nr:LysM domain-containing protein [Paucimonas lemoignei]